MRCAHSFTGCKHRQEEGRCWSGSGTSQMRNVRRHYNKEGVLMIFLKDKMIEGWKINIDKLIHTDKTFANYNFDYKIFESKSSNLGLLLYDIAEVRMGWEVGRLAIYQNKKRQQLILNARNLLCFYTSDTIQFNENESLIFLKVFIINDSSVEIPFLVLNLKDNMFSIIKVINSLPYSIEETQSNEFIFVEKYKDDRFEPYNGKTIDINGLDWFSINKIEKINEIYFH